MMRYKLFLLTLTLIGIIGCKSDDSLEARIEKLEKFKKEYETMQFEIQELEAEIVKLDSTKLNSKRKGKLITTLTVQKKVFTSYIDIQGNAESDLNIELSAETSGKAVSLLVKEGEDVRKGQLLIKLDDAVILKEIENIIYSLELATTVFERQENLWQQNIGSELQYLEVKNKKDILEVQLDKLKTQLDKTRIISPIDGNVENIRIKIGEMAIPAYPLLNVVNLSQITVKADVPERFVGKVKYGEKVTINFPALGIDRTATISAVGNIINPRNRTFKVEVLLPNKDKTLKANLLAIVRIIDYQNTDAVTLPTRLIQYGNGESFVYVVDKKEEDPIAKRIIIKAGVSYGAETEILSGLQAGDAVIDEGSHDVTDGTLLNIQNEPIG